MELHVKNFIKFCVDNKENPRLNKAVTSLFYRFNNMKFVDRTLPRCGNSILFNYLHHPIKDIKKTIVALEGHSLIYFGFKHFFLTTVAYTINDTALMKDLFCLEDFFTEAIGATNKQERNMCKKYFFDTIYKGNTDISDRYLKRTLENKYPVFSESKLTHKVFDTELINNSIKLKEILLKEFPYNVYHLEDSAIIEVEEEKVNSIIGNISEVLSKFMDVRSLTMKTYIKTGRFLSDF